MPINVFLCIITNTIAWFYMIKISCISKQILSHGSTLTHRKKFATLAGGCAPEASTLPPVTVSPIFLYQIKEAS